MNQSSKGCCVCGEPSAIKNGLYTLAAFEVRLRTPDAHTFAAPETRHICRSCAGKVTVAWATKMRGKCRPHGLE